MCDVSAKLIAWLDQELPPDEAADVERHLETCSECRGHLDEYKRASNEFDAYCDEAIASSVRHGVPRWVPVVSAAGAVAALVMMFLILSRTPVESPAFHPPQIAVAASPVVVATSVSAPLTSFRRVRRRDAVAPVQSKNANFAPTQTQNIYFLAEEPVIQIDIPADEMFSPGAVPPGMHFIADLTIAADGSAERLRLRPQLTGYERRTTQP
jgi:anti-sigma factor RsiW